MRINRRNFIKQSIALGAAALGTGSVLSACSSGITRQDLTRKSAPQAASAKLQKEHFSILHHVSLAPSGHNSQPWIVRHGNPGLQRLVCQPFCGT